MSTGLSRTTSSVRKLIFFAILVGILLTIFSPVIFPKGGIGVTPSVRPSISGTVNGNCPASNKVFGKIPKMKLSSYVLAAGTQAKFTFDSTAYPTFPSTLSVYQLDKMYARLGDVDAARETATAVGLNAGSEIGDDISVNWQNTNETKILVFNKSNHTWDFTTNLNNTTLSMLSGTIDSYLTPIDNVQKVVQLANTNYTGYEYDYRYVLRKFDRTMQSVQQLTKANILNINIYKSVEAITCRDSQNKAVITRGRVLAPDYKDQSFTAQLTGAGQNLKTDLLSFKIREFKISTTVGIYPTLSFDEAFAQLQENKGILYWILPENGDIYSTYKELKITKFIINVNSIKVVYLEPQKYQDNDIATHYIQPYYQFSGTALTDTNQNAEFIFLVPALQSDNYS